MKLKHLFLLLLTVTSSSVFSQSEDGFPTFRMNGTLKTKVEYASAIEQGRFSVRNSRLIFGGKVAPMVDYRGQLELSGLGRFQVLDLVGIIKPIDNLALTFGQATIPLLDTYVHSPGQIMFANRTFAVELAGTRDIGLMAAYSFNAGNIPILAEAGIFNANDINQAVWTDTLSYIGRLSFGSMDGWRLQGKVYNYPNAVTQQHFVFYGMSARYATQNWRIEAEALKRDDQNDRNLSVFSTYLQGAYVYPIQSKLFKSIIPAFRWDTMDQNLSENAFDVNRFTWGLSFALTDRSNPSLIRIDYEWYKVNNRINSFFPTPDTDSNKITLELLLNF
ncbi:MAG: hypothetical protein LBI15_00680 [Dysgonamonadaceae bacterium]|nr:hypothetical protein [Dysgonamonadaceae bacterium]